MSTRLLILCSLCALLLPARAVTLPGAVATWQSTHPGKAFLGVGGDSIAEGYTNWLSFVDVAPNGQGNTNGDVSVLAPLRAGVVFRGTNCASSGQTVGGAFNFTSALLAEQIAVLFWHVGINTLAAGGTNVYWSNSVEHFDNLLALCRASNTVLFVGNIWPWAKTWTNEIRQWNLDELAWAASNGVVVVDGHTGMSDPADRDQLLAANTWDGQHPSALGVTNHADLLLAALTNSIFTYVPPQKVTFINRVTIRGGVKF